VGDHNQCSFAGESALVAGNQIRLEGGYSNSGFPA
jgi:hypothetical protein